MRALPLLSGALLFSLASLARADETQVCVRFASDASFFDIAPRACALRSIVADGVTRTLDVRVEGRPCTTQPPQDAIVVSIEVDSAEEAVLVVARSQTGVSDAELEHIVDQTARELRDGLAPPPVAVHHVIASAKARAPVWEDPYDHRERHGPGTGLVLIGAGMGVAALGGVVALVGGLAQAAGTYASATGAIFTGREPSKTNVSGAYVAGGVFAGVGGALFLLGAGSIVVNAVF